MSYQSLICDNLCGTQFYPLFVVCVQELLGMLGRRRHPEMFVKELLKKKLQGSALGIRWHVRDLLGSGALQQLDTTSGPLLRIVKRH